MTCVVQSQAQASDEDNYLPDAKEIIVVSHIPEQQPQAQSIPNPQTTEDSYTQTITKQGGVNYYNGMRETYYSSRVLRHYMIGSWHTDSKGFWRDSDGNFILSSNDYSYGSIVHFSQGIGKVYDSGCARGTLDVYVSW